MIFFILFLAMCSNFSGTEYKVTWLKKVTNNIKEKNFQNKKKYFIKIFLAEVLSIPKNIDNIAKNKCWKF